MTQYGPNMFILEKELTMRFAIFKKCLIIAIKLGFCLSFDNI